MPETDPGNLDRLHDIIVPAPAPWWPPAPAWYAVTIIVLVLIAVLTWQLVARWNHNRYRRAALRELDRTSHDGNLVQSLAVLLKRTALAAFPREAVASLTGERWLQFLNATGGTEGFTQYPGNVFGDTVYQHNPDVMAKHVATLFHIVRHWIKHHRC